MTQIDTMPGMSKLVTSSSDIPPSLNLWRHHLQQIIKNLKRTLHKTNLSFKFISRAVFCSYITLIVKIICASWWKPRKLNNVIVQHLDLDDQGVINSPLVCVLCVMRLWPIITTPRQSGKQLDVRAIVFQLDCLEWKKKRTFRTFFRTTSALLWNTTSSPRILTISMLKIKPGLKQLMLRSRKSLPSSLPNLLKTFGLPSWETHTGFYKFSIIFTTLPSDRFPFLLNSPAVSPISYLNSKKSTWIKGKKQNQPQKKYIKKWSD